MKTLTRVVGDDWAGLYVDGTLIHEGHSVADWPSLAVLAEFGFFLLDSFECDSDWLHEEGGLPRRIEDVKRMR